MDIAGFKVILQDDISSSVFTFDLSYY